MFSAVTAVRVRSIGSSTTSTSIASSIVGSCTNTNAITRSITTAIITTKRRKMLLIAPKRTITTTSTIAAAIRRSTTRAHSSVQLLTLSYLENHQQRRQQQKLLLLHTSNNRHYHDQQQHKQQQQLTNWTSTTLFPVTTTTNDDNSYLNKNQNRQSPFHHHRLTNDATVHNCQQHNKTWQESGGNVGYVVEKYRIVPTPTKRPILMNPHQKFSLTVAAETNNITITKHCTPTPTRKVTTTTTFYRSVINKNIPSLGIIANNYSSMCATPSSKKYYHRARRQFSTTPESDSTVPTPIPSTSPSTSADILNGDSTNTTTISKDADVEQAINKIFEESENQQLPELEPVVDAWYSAAGATSDTAASALTALTDSGIWEPGRYNLPDYAILYIQYIHNSTGLEYWLSIILATTILKTLLFPFMVVGQQHQSRMAHANPEIKLMKSKYDKLGTPTRQEQLQLGKNMQTILKRYNVNHFYLFMGPLLQLPIFVSFFFGLRKLPKIFPEDMQTGGAYWFVDLTVPDPYFIIPLCTSLTFLLQLELGKDQLRASNSDNPGQAELMLNVFRFITIAMFPVTLTFETGLLCYWICNNLLTLGQTLLFKNKVTKKYLGIWDLPKPIPGSEPPKSLFETIADLQKRYRGEPITKKEYMTRHNAKVEAEKATARLVRASRSSSSSSSSRPITESFTSTRRTPLGRSRSKKN